LADLKLGVVGIPGKWSTEILADAVEARTGHRIVIDMGQVGLDLAKQRLVYQDHDLCTLDGIIVKKIAGRYCPNTLDRLELLRVAEQAGVRVFSPAESIIRLVDRLSCTVTLQKGGIPMPETRVTEDLEMAITAIRDFGSAVFKPLYSTKARGMCLINSVSDPATVAAKVLEFQKDNPMMYIQKEIALQGRDLGLVFLGGKYLGGYARVSQNDSWNTTTHSGGHYTSWESSDAVVDVASRAQALFNMDFTTVDVAETEGGPVVFEVSAFGGFRGVLDGIGINAADLYVEYVMNELSG